MLSISTWLRPANVKALRITHPYKQGSHSYHTLLCSTTVVYELLMMRVIPIICSFKTGDRPPAGEAHSPDLRLNRDTVVDVDLTLLFTPPLSSCSPFARHGCSILFEGAFLRRRFQHVNFHPFRPPRYHRRYNGIVVRGISVRKLCITQRTVVMEHDCGSG